MKCIYCGEEIEYVGVGRKRQYCDKAECLDKLKQDRAEKYKQNRLAKKAKMEPILVVEDNPVYEEPAITANELIQDLSDILEISRQLGSIRFQLIQLVEQERAEQSKYDKLDQQLLHELEFNNNITTPEILELWKNGKENRARRRNAKQRIQLLQLILNGITIKNPSKAAAQYIQKSGRCSNINVIVNQLIQDETVFDKNYKFNGFLKEEQS